MRTLGCHLLLASLASVSTAAQAHGGGLDRDGCHNDRRNNSFHCHRGGAAPVRQHRDADASTYLPRNNLTRGDTSRPVQAFSNCTEARAAGAAPVHRGEPGYGSHLDRDDDGIGCEPYRGR